jgi:5-methylcytosine-specific restriction protein A
LPAHDTGIAAQTDESDDQAIGRSPLEDAYRRLCGVAERSSKRNAGKHVSRTSKEPIRSAAARRAVLLRSKGNCENPDCIGHPDVLTDAGDPILEIDDYHNDDQVWSTIFIYIRSWTGGGSCNLER